FRPVLEMVCCGGDFFDENSVFILPLPPPPLVKSLCNSLCFGTLPNGDESVKAQSTKPPLAHQVAQPLRGFGTEQPLQHHRGQRTEEPPIALTLRLPVLHL